MKCPECPSEATGRCPLGFRKHRQCPCCRLCVREDGERRHCGGTIRDVKAARLLREKHEKDPTCAF